jgi:hypothetical protein
LCLTLKTCQVKSYYSKLPISQGIKKLAITPGFVRIGKEDKAYAKAYLNPSSITCNKSSDY